MKKEIKSRKWMGRLHSMVSGSLDLHFLGYTNKHNKDGVCCVTSVRIGFVYEDLFSPHPTQVLCIWDATAEDVAVFINEKPNGAEWFLAHNGDISLMVEFRPSGKRRADMVKYPPVNHSTI